MHEEIDGRLDEQWRAALADAGIGEENACLIIVEGPRSENANMAEHHRPQLHAMPTAVLRGDDLEKANSPACVGRHRIAIWRPADVDPVELALAAAKLRHELEHARQWPVELDANAAGARFLRQRFPPDLVERVCSHEEGRAMKSRLHRATGHTHSSNSRVHAAVSGRLRLGSLRSSHQPASRIAVRELDRGDVASTPSREA
jgi:hypothetical protein